MEKDLLNIIDEAVKIDPIQKIKNRMRLFGLAAILGGTYADNIKLKTHNEFLKEYKNVELLVDKEILHEPHVKELFKDLKLDSRITYDITNKQLVIADSNKTIRQFRELSKYILTTYSIKYITSFTKNIHDILFNVKKAKGFTKKKIIEIQKALIEHV